MLIHSPLIPFIFCVDIMSVLAVTKLLQHMYLILCIPLFVHNIINYGSLSLIVHSNFL